MQTAIEVFFHHNRWANLQLIDFCTNLDDAVLDASLVGTHGTVRVTLLHLVAAESRYIDLLIGKRPENPVSERLAWPGFAELRRIVEWNSEQYLALIPAFIPRILRGERNGEAYTLPSTIPLLQAINHGTDHRSQIATILTQQGITPPELDAWHYLDEQTEKS